MKTNILTFLAVLVAAWGAVTDLRTHKIYNRLTGPSILAGIVLHVFFWGIRGFFNSLLGLLLGVCCTVFWVLGMLKAGDIKLYIAVGALGGWKFCGYTIIFSVLIGGIVSVILMLSRKSGRASLKRLWKYFIFLGYTKKFSMYHPEESHAYFSFGSCIFAGSLAACSMLLR